MSEEPSPDYFIETVQELRWNDTEHSSFDCLVKFSSTKVALPFTASQDDPEGLGRELFQRGAAGEFGPIAPPPISHQPGRSDEPIDLSEQITPDFLNFVTSVNQEIASGSLRAAILVMASGLEEVLKRLIEGFLVEDAVTAKMLENRTSAQLCRLAFSFGLITRKEMREIQSFGEIRNSFAHSWHSPRTKGDLDKSTRGKLQNFYESYASDKFLPTDNLRLFVQRGGGTAAMIHLVALWQRLEEVALKRCHERTE